MGGGSRAGSARRLPGRLCRQRGGGAAGRLDIGRVAMDQHDREGAVHQQHDLARELGRGGGAMGGAFAGEPALEAGLVARADLDGGVAGQGGELGGGAQEAAALPARMAGGAGEVDEDRRDLVRQTAFGLLEPAGHQPEIGLVARFQIGGDELVLAGEMIIERALGHAGLFGDGVDADGADALAIKQLARRFDDAPARRALGGLALSLGHAAMYTV